MNRIITALVLGLFAIGAGPIDQLDRFAGTWQTQGTFLATPYSKAATASGTTSCAWSNDHLFMICQQAVTLGETLDHDVAIYSYDETGKAYRFYNVRPSQATSSTITISGNTVTYPFSFADNGKNVMIRTLNLWQNAGSYTWRTEYSIDGGKTWTLMASGTSSKT